MSKKLFIITNTEVSNAKFMLWLQADSEFEIVGEANSIKDFHRQIISLKPDVIIIDSESIDLDKSLDLLDKIGKYDIKKLVVFSYHSSHIFILNKIKSEVKAYSSERECRTIFIKALKKD